MALAKILYSSIVWEINIHSYYNSRIFDYDVELKLAFKKENLLDIEIGTAGAFKVLIITTVRSGRNIGFVNNAKVKFATFKFNYNAFYIKFYFC